MTRSAEWRSGDKEETMPIQKVKGGWKFGRQGKVYPTREQAARQGRAIKAQQAQQAKKK